MQTVDLLITRGAKLDQIDKLGHTALHLGTKHLNYLI
jgi:hypothetical protein